MSIITYPLNGVTYHAEDAETYLCSRASGVYSAEGCFDVSISDDMELSVSPGLAWIKNGDRRGKSVCSTETEVLEVPIADASLPRIDRVVIEFTTASNGSTIKLVTGTPAAEPAAPAIVQTATVFQLGLCTVRVPAAATALQARHITDTRTDETVCGLMRDAVTRIPTAELREQFIDDVQAIVDNIRDILDEDTAAHLLLLIDEKLNAPDTATSLPASGTALTANTIYTVASAVNTYQFTPPASGWVHGTFTTGESPDITFDAGARFMNFEPIFAAEQTYEFDWLCGVWSFCEVV